MEGSKKAAADTAKDKRSSTSSSRQRPRNDDAQAECLTKLKYSCLIPPVPCDPKALVISLDNRYVKYQATSLERSHRFELHIAPDLGIPRDLVDPATHKPADPRPELAPQDYALLHGEDPKKATQRTQQREAGSQGLQGSQEQHAALQPSPQRPASPSRPSQQGSQLAQAAEPVLVVPSVDEQLRAIEESFAAAREPPVVAGETPEESMDLLPAFDLWANSYQHVVAREGPFEASATRRDADVERSLEDRAIIKAFNASGHNFVTYFTPREPLAAGAPEPQEEEYEWLREYSYSTRSDQTDALAIVVTGGAARYVKLNRRVVLTKFTDRDAADAVRRVKRGRRVRVVRRAIGDAEKKARDEVLSELAERASDEEDDEDMPAGNS